ncbi:MAG: hypothetical protein FWD44_04775 [Oscillospiraceae bacterium]|nr:hypothetical protein [Oscillospiraceae bacterium]
MKKYFLLFMLLLLTFLLTGCLQVNIDIGIDSNYSSFLTYRVEIDLSEIDPQYHSILVNSLNRIGWHYQEELNFTAGLNTNDDIHVLTMTKRTANSNFKQAFDSLERKLTNEDMTAFMEVDMSIQSFPRQELYYLYAMLDIPQILRLSSAEELPPDMLIELEGLMAERAGTLTLTMPVSEVLKSSQKTNMQYYHAEMAVPLSYTDITEFEFAASLIFMEDGSIGRSFDEISDHLLSMRNMAFIVCAGAVLLLLIAVVAILVRR